MLGKNKKNIRFASLLAPFVLSSGGRFILKFVYTFKDRKKLEYILDIMPAIFLNNCHPLIFISGPKQKLYEQHTAAGASQVAAKN